MRAQRTQATRGTQVGKMGREARESGLSWESALACSSEARNLRA